MRRSLKACLAVTALSAGLAGAVTLAQGQSRAQGAIPTITIDDGAAKAKVSPTLYGIMTEEINFSYEGGLYGNVIRNGTMKENLKEEPANDPAWQGTGGGAISVDTTTPLNDALNISLKLDASAAGAGIANSGFWGIPVRPNTRYRVSFFARSDKANGPLTVALQSKDGATTYAAGQVKSVGAGWRKYQLTIATKDVPTTKDTRFVITTAAPGTLWFQNVTLFPPTVNNRPNGTRPDLMKLLGDMHPAFLRFPGGNYLEGNLIGEHFDWKRTIGALEQRPGHESPWNYWSTDGFGLLEFLEWCEDLHMQPVLAVYAGYSLRQDRIKPGKDLAPYVQDALDEIEFVTGGTDTKWGAMRARLGHPKPFALHYVEIGNEDFFDRADTYDARFSQFHNAIKKKYPQLQTISTITADQARARPGSGVTSVKYDVEDEHLYPGNEGAMESRAHEFDSRPRGGAKIFVGEWATRIGSPTPNMLAALADAAWMTGMERNSDLVVMSGYAPLLVNVSDITAPRGQGSMQWMTDLIGYDALTSYGSPSYWAQQMFYSHHGDEILNTSEANIPTWTWQPPAGRGGRGPNGQRLPPPPAPPPEQLPSLFHVVTRDSKSGLVTIKLVNRNGAPQPVHIVLKGAGKVAPTGTALVLKANSTDETNSITDPRHIVPVRETVRGLSADFTRTLPAYSITVLEVEAR